MHTAVCLIVAQRSRECHMGQLYAVLVGIDLYPSPVPTLAGCRADVEAVKALLRERKPDARILTLVDAEATRQRVVEAISDHLGQGNSDDTVLLFYSGHGSHRPTARPGGLAPSEQDQTLVLYDSRLPESRDLLDAELGDLITGVAQGGAHVVVILDCCHSGSGTRDPFEATVTTIRQAPSDPRSHLYLPTDHGELAEAGPRQAGWALGVGRHVLIAACQPHQTAKEVTMPSGVRRGALGASLEQVLRS